MGKNTNKTKLRSVKRAFSRRRNPKDRMGGGQPFVLDKTPQAAPPAEVEEGGKKKAFIIGALAIIVLLALVIWGCTRNGNETQTADENPAVTAAVESGDTQPEITDTPAAASAENTVTSQNSTTQTQEKEEDETAAPVQSAPVMETSSAPEGDEPVVRTISYAGYEVTLESHDDHTVISYPEILSASDVISFIGSEEDRYGIPSSSVSALITGKDEITLAYAPIENEDERAAVLSVIEADLIGYISSLMAAAEVSEPVTAAQPEAVKEETLLPVTVEENTQGGYVVKTISLAGYTAFLTSYADRTVIGYPSVVGAGDVASFLESERERYGLSKTDFSYLTTGEDEMSVYYGNIEDEAVRSQILDVVEADLIAYLSSLMSASQRETAADVQPRSEVLSHQEESAATVSTTTVNNITVNNTVSSIMPLAPQEMEEEEEWKEIKHSLSLSMTPYAFDYVDFYNVRDALKNAGIAAEEFQSYYGLGINASYEWRVMKHLSLGLEAGIYRYYQNRSYLPEKTYYTQIPLTATLVAHSAGKHIDVFGGIGIGADIADLTKMKGVYFLLNAQAGISLRFAEHFSFFWKAEASMTFQPHPVNESLDSITYAIQPVLLGFTYHI